MSLAAAAKQQRPPVPTLTPKRPLPHLTKTTPASWPIPRLLALTERRGCGWQEGGQNARGAPADDNSWLVAHRSPPSPPSSFPPFTGLPARRPPNPRRWFTEVGEFVILKEHGGFEVREPAGGHSPSCLHAWLRSRGPCAPANARRCHVDHMCARARTHTHTQTHTHTHTPTPTHTHTQVAATFAADKPSDIEINTEYSWTQTIRIASPDGEAGATRGGAAPSRQLFVSSDSPGPKPASGPTLLFRGAAARSERGP